MVLVEQAAPFSNGTDPPISSVTTSVDVSANCATMYVQLVALACTAYVLYRICSQVWSGVRSFLMSNDVDFAAFGTWAVVTGATGGIGFAYAKEMAARGLDVYLLGRSEAKLSALRDKLQKMYPGRRFETLCVDFAQATATTTTGAYDRLQSALGELDVGVLVNNAGCADDLPGLMHEMDIEQGMAMMQTNMSAVVMLSHCILGGMQRRQRGAVINVSSFAALNVCPMMSLYAATKMFVFYLTRTLESEYGRHNVKFQCVTPSFVQTKMAANLQDASQSNVLMPSPEAYVKSALNTFDVNVTTTGYWFHGFFATVLHLLPCSLSRKLGDVKMAEMIEYAKDKRSASSTSKADNASNNHVKQQ